jgi:ADP-L-glycero-D-manno-heptose 6-epimerase
MIAITGAAGFIGSCLAREYNLAGRDDLVLVDQFDRPDKARNLENKRYREKVERERFAEWLERHADRVEIVFHLGARTDTTEKSVEVFDQLNVRYSQSVWSICARQGIPLVYASSAATYGLGEYGYRDAHELVERLRPLNPYGASKNDFDRWALAQTQAPPFWAGLKFFNVYGPNEYHKGRMASVVFHTARQIKADGRMRLFRSHRADVRDGEQRRDFIYVKDVTRICRFFHQSSPRRATPNGLYNVGTGKARTFLDLAKATFKALELAPAIEFIDTPEDIRDTYQYFTEADMSKLRAAGYQGAFHELEAGVDDYVRHYLREDIIW